MGQYSISIPAWEQTQLTNLAANNQLSGLDPRILAGIDQAESSGDPGTPNSSGYGGYFGLSPTSNYPAGQVGSGEGQNNATEFDKEAVIAASEFASLLSSYGGDIIHAEYAYQQGGNAPYPGDAAALKTEGPSIVNQALGGSLQTGAAAPSGGASGSSSGSGGTNTTQLKGFGAILQSLDSVMNPSGGSTITQILTLGGSDVVAKVEGLVVRSVFAFGFIGIAYFGFKALTSGGGGGAFSGGSYPGQGIVRDIQGQQRLGIQERAQTVSETRVGQAETRLQERAREEARKVEVRRERRNMEQAGEQGRHVKRGKHAADPSRVTDALKTVGEAAVVLAPK